MYLINIIYTCHSIKTIILVASSFNPASDTSNLSYPVQDLLCSSSKWLGSICWFSWESEYTLMEYYICQYTQQSFNHYLHLYQSLLVGCAMIISISTLNLPNTIHFMFNLLISPTFNTQFSQIHRLPFFYHILQPSQEFVLCHKLILVPSALDKYS